MCREKMQGRSEQLYLSLSFSSDEHHRSHSCLGTGMRVGIQNFFVIIVRLWTFTSAIFLVCLMVKRPQYHITACSVNGSETGDPHNHRRVLADGTMSHLEDLASVLNSVALGRV